MLSYSHSIGYGCFLYLTQQSVLFISCFYSNTYIKIVFKSIFKLNKETKNNLIHSNNLWFYYKIIIRVFLKIHNTCYLKTREDWTSERR